MTAYRLGWFQVVVAGNICKSHWITVLLDLQKERVILIDHMADKYWKSPLPNKLACTPYIVPRLLKKIGYYESRGLIPVWNGGIWSVLYANHELIPTQHDA